MKRTLHITPQPTDPPDDETTLRCFCGYFFDKWPTVSTAKDWDDRVSVKTYASGNVFKYFDRSYYDLCKNCLNSKELPLHMLRYTTL